MRGKVNFMGNPKGREKNRPGQAWLTSPDLVGLPLIISTEGVIVTDGIASSTGHGSGPEPEGDLCQECATSYSGGTQDCRASEAET